MGRLAQRHQERQGGRDQVRIRQSARVQRCAHLLQQPIYQGRPGELFSIFYTVKRVAPFQSLCALKIMHVLIRERLKKTRNGERPIKRSAQPLKG